MFSSRLLIAATVLCAQGAFASNFFPINQGNSWTYQDRGSGQVFTVRVGSPVYTNEKVYYSLAGYTEQRVLVRQEGDAILVLDEESGREAILTSFEPFEGGWWNAHARACDPMGQTQVKRGVHDGPAGPIPDVLEIRYRNSGCADTGVEAEQYAENIGMVRRTVQTFAGPRTFDLVSARVGSQRIIAGPHGSFTIAYGTQGDMIGITLRIEADPVEAITLPFDSGQEYDVVVRDDQDHVVYVWSSTALFTQAAHQLRIAGEWTRTVAIPRPVLPGHYTVHAWMTTSGGASRYAATAPLIVPQK